MMPFQNTQSLFKEFISCFHVTIFLYIVVIRHEQVTHLSMCLLPTTTTLLVPNNKASVFPFTIFPTAKPMRFINADQKLILILLR